MDAVADSIALRSLRQLGNGRSIAAVPRAYFGSRSLPALKLFLRGEQRYRKNDFEAARADYEQAIALDSGFALAYRRMRGVLRGINGEFDSLSLDFAARAGAANRRSSPRDSLLILADSLAAVHRLPAPAFADGRWLGSIRRRLATLQAAAQLYPDDPEVWSELGEARVHFGERVGVDDRAALDAFERRSASIHVRAGILSRDRSHTSIAWRGGGYAARQSIHSSESWRTNLSCSCKASFAERHPGSYWSSSTHWEEGTEHYRRFNSFCGSLTPLTLRRSCMCIG